MRGIAMFLLAVAVTFTALSFWSYRITAEFLERATTTTGTVTSSHSGGGRKQFLSFEYQDSTGRTHQARSQGQGSWYGWRAGDQVRVVYDPEMPKQVYLDMLMELWFPPLALGTVALIFWFLGVIFAYFAWTDPFSTRPTVWEPAVTRRQTVAAAVPGSEVRRLVNEGRIIPAIKLYRQETGLGLLDAKTVIDELRRQ